ncbi:MAG TPA: M48 family metalloprotease [Burkholderiales bacterium]|nr:M48 family metalloprotease [Burkholderiales bacterium]
MGFFEQQDRARRATARLLVLYTLTVALIVACANLVVVPFYIWWAGAPATPAVYATVSLATLCVIALGSLEIIARLSIGEHELGLVLAGRRVPRGSGIEAERRLINVVDEMAIASGLAAPPLYVLNREDGINAFAAGRSPNQAIVVVTKGALEQLPRDELQAVIAHEFGHILNGDIRLNLRAACALQGIVFLSAIGRFMMQYYSGYGTEEGRRFFHLPFAVIGAGFYGLGFVGLIGARLIQAAIAREREYLADACAVRYTRNADALCGALARIERHPQGSSIRNWHAESLAHMLFAPNRSAWYATHPPIDTRMRRANPHLAPEVYFERLERPRPVIRKKAEVKETPRTIVPSKLTAVAALVASIGEPDGAALEYAAGVLAYLPTSIREALASADGAQAVMVGMIIDAEATARGRQLRALEALGRGELARRAEVLAPLIAQLDRAYRLPIVALALPVLRTELAEAGRNGFLAAMRAAIEADKRLTLGEFVLDTILDWNLGAKAKRAGGVKFRSRDQVKDECALILSLLAHAGGSEALFARVAPGLALKPRDALQLASVSEALERLSQLAPLEKEPLIAACAELVSADGNVKLLEHELLRAIGAVLDCPMPPSIAALDPRLLRK